MRFTTQLQSFARSGQRLGAQPPAQQVRPGSTTSRSTGAVPAIWRIDSVDGPVPQRRISSTQESIPRSRFQVASRAVKGWLRRLDLRRRTATPRPAGGILRDGTPMPADLGTLARSTAITQQAQAMVAAAPDAQRPIAGQWLVVFCAPAAATPTDSRAQRQQIDAIVARLCANPDARCVLTGGSAPGPAAAENKHDSAYYRAAIRAQVVSLDLRDRIVPENRATNVAEQAWFSMRLLDRQVMNAPKSLRQLVLVCLDSDRLEATQWLLAARQLSSHLREVDIVVHSFV